MRRDIPVINTAPAMPNAVAVTSLPENIPYDAFFYAMAKHELSRPTVIANLQAAEDCGMSELMYFDADSQPADSKFGVYGVLGRPSADGFADYLARTYDAEATNEGNSSPTPTPTPSGTTYKYFGFVPTLNGGGRFQLVDLFLVDDDGNDDTGTIWTERAPVDGRLQQPDGSAASLNDARNNNYWASGDYRGNYDYIGEYPVLIGIASASQTIFKLGLYSFYRGNAQTAFRLYGSADPISADLSNATLLLDHTEADGQWQDFIRREFAI